MPATRPRYPRYSRFIGTGVVIGLLAALALTFLVVDDPTQQRQRTRGAERTTEREYSRQQTFLYLGVLLGATGALAGGGAAVASESISVRRRRSAP